MRIKKNNGFVAIDAVIAILAIMIFSIIIVYMIYNNFMANARIKLQALATIYLTETLENVGIAEYEDITQEKINDGQVDLVPEGVKNSSYNMEITIEELDGLNEEQKEDQIIKKVKATISYELVNKNYQCSMERIKAK